MRHGEEAIGMAAQVARAIDELVVMVRTYPRENMASVDISEHDVALFKAYYSGLMYKVREGPCVVGCLCTTVCAHTLLAFLLTTAGVWLVAATLRLCVPHRRQCSRPPSVALRL